MTTDFSLRSVVFYILKNKKKSLDKTIKTIYNTNVTKPQTVGGNAVSPTEV